MVGFLRPSVSTFDNHEKDEPVPGASLWCMNGCAEMQGPTACEYENSEARHSAATRWSTAGGFSVDPPVPVEIFKDMKETMHVMRGFDLTRRHPKGERGGRCRAWPAKR